MVICPPAPNPSPVSDMEGWAGPRFHLVTWLVAGAFCTGVAASHRKECQGQLVWRLKIS